MAETTITVAVAEFRAHLALYLSHVMKGQVVVLTSHGRVVAELKPPADERARAREELQQLGQTATVGDLLSPAIDEFRVG